MKFYCNVGCNCKRPHLSKMKRRQDTKCFCARTDVDSRPMTCFSPSDKIDSPAVVRGCDYGEKNPDIGYGGRSSKLDHRAKVRPLVHQKGFDGGMG